MIPQSRNGLEEIMEKMIEQVITVIEIGQASFSRVIVFAVQQSFGCRLVFDNVIEFPERMADEPRQEPIDVQVCGHKFGDVYPGQPTPDPLHPFYPWTEGSQHISEPSVLVIDSRRHQNLESLLVSVWHQTPSNSRVFLFPFQLLIHFSHTNVSAATRTFAMNVETVTVGEPQQHAHLI